MGIRHGSHMLAGRPVCVALSSVDNSPGCFFGTDVNMEDSKNIEELLGKINLYIYIKCGYYIMYKIYIYRYVSYVYTGPQ